VGPQLSMEREGVLSVGEQPVVESGGPTPEQDVRAAGNHLRDAAAVLRQALAADDELGGGPTPGAAGTTDGGAR
jgi:hypothetical protein